MGCRGPVSVGVELGEFAVDVDGVGAVEMRVLVVGRPDMRDDLTRHDVEQAEDGYLAR